MNFYLIYEKYKKDVYYFLYHMSHNKDVSEELTSEVFLEVIKSLSSFRGDSDIKTWIFGIARFKWLEFLRKEKRDNSLNERLAMYINENDILCDNNFENNEIINRVMKLLECEGIKNKEVVLMRINGYSFYEIATKLNISESSARVIDFRTKKKIKEILRKEGYICE